MNLIKLVGRNLRRSLRRTIFTAVTVAVTTFIYSLLVSVPGSIDRIVKDNSNTLRVVVLNRNLPFVGLPARYCDEVAKMKGAVACLAVSGWPATYQDVSNPIFAIAEGLEVADVFPDYDISGESRRAFSRERRGAFVGHVMMRKYHWKRGQQVTLRGTDRNHLELTFVIINEMANKRYPNLFAFRRDYLEEAQRKAGVANPGLVWNLVVRVDKSEDVSTVMREIDETFRNSDYETRSLTESDALAGGLASVGDIRSIVFALCGVVVLTVLLIAANSSAMMVRERTNEIAIMRSLGFRKTTLAAMLLGECAAIGLVGGVLGAGAALWIFSSGAAPAALLGGFGALWVTARGSTQAAAVAAAVVIASGVIPVANALAVPPAIGVREIV